MPLKFKEASDAFRQIESSKLDGLKDEMYKAGIRYAHIRAENLFFKEEEKEIADKERTLAHNRFIDCCNILSRNQQKNGEDNSWRSLLGNDRKTIGDFACYIHLFTAISNR